MADSGLSTVLRDALERIPGVVSAYLFGSTADGRAHRESDVDLGVLLDRAIYPSPADRFEIRLRLSTALQAEVLREVDLVILNDAPPHLARHIMTRGQNILVVDRERDHAHLRLMLSRAADLEPFLRRARAAKLRALSR